MLGLSVPEADGGAGGSLVDQAVAVEELGASLACGPVFGTVFLAIPALVAASAGTGARRTAGRARRGPPDRGVRRRRPRGAFDPSAVTVTATGDRLSGTVERVVDAGAADDLLVAAEGPDWVGLYAVDATGPASSARRWSPST